MLFVYEVDGILLKEYNVLFVDVFIRSNKRLLWLSYNMSLKLFFCQRASLRFLCLIVPCLLVKSLIYKGILEVLYYNKLLRYGRFKRRIVVVKIDILLDMSLLIVECELYIPLKPVPFKSKLDICIKEVRCYFERKRASL